MKMCETPYKVSCHIALCNDAHTVAINVIILCMEGIVLYVLGDKHVKVIKSSTLKFFTFNRN
jgi:hypothetical protein